MRTATSFLSACLLAILGSGCSTGPAARVYRIETPDQRLGGASALAFEGDWILENDHVRAAILAERCTGTQGIDQVCTSPGPGLYGGSLIDVDIQRADSAHGSGRGNDRFAEMFAAINLDVTATQSVEVLADGSDGGPAILRVQGPPGDYISFMGLLGGILGLARGWYVTDWILRPGDPYVTVRTHVVFQDPPLGQEITRPSSDPCGWAQGDPGLPCDDWLLDVPRDVRIPTVDALNSAATQFGDFFFAGGSVDVFLPGIGFQEDLATLEALDSGVNPFVDPFDLPFIAAVGEGVSYALGSGGRMAAPIFTASLTAVYGAAHMPPLDADGDPIQPADGTVMTYQRFLGLGDGDIASAVDSLYTAFLDHGLGTGLGTLRGRVVEDTTMAPLPGVEVIVWRDVPEHPRDAFGLPPSEDLYLHFRTDSGTDRVEDGSFEGRLPGGDYVLAVKDQTRGIGEPRKVTVIDGGIVETGLVADRAAVLEVEVLDERGRKPPCKVTLRPIGEDVGVSLPDLGDPYISGGYSQVLLLPHGSARAELPAGRYDVLVSRGLEYSAWDSAAQGWPDGVVLNPGQTTVLDAVLAKEIDSTGFISADLHVHASPSTDSGLSLETRVISMAAEGVEFMAGTDHDVITDYRPVIEALELDPWLQATPGVETSTLELGHYLGFPLVIDYAAQSHGAPDWTGWTPAQIFQGIRDKGAWGPEETAVWVGHPRDGILGYFDQYGLSHFEGSLLNPVVETPLIGQISNPLLDAGNFSLDFDGFELLNSKRLEMIRTPTQAEMDCQRSFLDGAPLPGCEHGVDVYDILARTMEEQEALDDPEQDFWITTEMEGPVDDWFNLLNLGFRHTGMGNSDTHTVSSTEAGCPRNYVVSPVDSPELLDPRDVARAIREHRVVASYGPLIRFEADGMPVGSDVTAQAGGVTLRVQVQAPRWMLVDRVEVYENGRLIEEFTGDDLDPDAVVKIDRQVPVAPIGEDGSPRDAWYVVAAMGRDGLAPVFTPVDLPYLQLNDVVVGALSEIDLGSLGDAVAGEGPPIPRTFPILPYAITNPIWVDADGNGSFDALGRIPEWFRPAPEPEE